jgi:YesN/AraC family two-component response regulator
MDAAAGYPAPRLSPLGSAPRREATGDATFPRAVLLVEDDASVRDVLALFLADLYQVNEASTGAEALTVLRDKAFAAIVLDHRLPDRSGLELLREMRDMRPSVPVIMISGYGSEWLCASAFKGGVSDYLPKPVSGFELVASVRRAIDGTAPDDLGPQGPVPRARDTSIHTVMNLVQHRYWERLSLPALAHEIGMSKYRLSHRFREVMGVSLRAYVTQVRLERAKRLLSAGTPSVTEVAHMVGFGDLPRFDKLFKQYTGFTPSAYRTRHWPGAKA